MESSFETADSEREKEQGTMAPVYFRSVLRENRFWIDAYFYPKRFSSVDDAIRMPT